MLIFIWMSMQVFIYFYRGIVTDLEATKYIEQANIFLQTGFYSSKNYIFYSVQILLIAFCIKFNISFSLLIIFQMLINGISIICFYKLIKQLTKNKSLSYFGVFYFIIFYYYYLFNTYLFTESIFFSFSVIYTYFLFSLKRISGFNGMLIFLFLILLYLTRPTGIFFLPATYLFLMIKFYSERVWMITGISSLFAVGLFFLFNYSLGSGGEYDFLLPYLKEMVICGIPTITNTHSISIPVEKNSIQGLFYIITHFPDLFFSLSIRRLSAFFGVSRTYYSLFHNIFISVYFYLMYLIILFGIRKIFSKFKAEVWFSITNIALMATTAVFSCDEWSNRFIISQLPFFLILAILSVSNLKSFSFPSKN